MADDDERDRQAEALKRMAGDGEKPAEPAPPPPPQSTVLFRQARPAVPGSSAPEAHEGRRARPTAPPSHGEAPIAPADVTARRLNSVSASESDTLPIYVPPTDSAAAPSSTTPHALTAARTLERKRTFIPILLTCGTMLLVVGAARWVVADDSAFKLMSAGMSLAVLAFGLLLLFLAVLNMLQVRDQIAAAAPESQPPAR